METTGLSSSSTHVLQVRLWAPRESLRALRDSLVRIGGPTRARRECRHYGVYQSTVDPEELMLLAEWSSREALESSIRSADFRVVLSAMDASTRDPHFQVETVRSTEGFECVASILGHDEK